LHRPWGGDRDGPSSSIYLRRVRGTPALRGLNRRERALCGFRAFALSKSGKAAIADRTIIL
jgi:hypothetical protein